MNNKRALSHMMQSSLKKLAVAVLMSVLAVPALAEEAEEVVIGEFIPAAEYPLIKAHTISYSSVDALDLMPVHVVGRLIFLKILGNPSVFAQLDSADGKIIIAMPDASDERFTRPFAERVLQGCQKFLDDPETYSPLAAGIELNETSAFLDSLVDQYYLDALVNRFTEAAANLIVQYYDDIKGTGAIGYTRIDYAGLSEVLPAGVTSTYEALCNWHMSQEDVHRTSLIIDRFPGYRPFYVH